MRTRSPLTALVLGAGLTGAAGCSIEIDLDRDTLHTGGYAFDHDGVSLSRHESGQFASVPAAVVVDNRFGGVEVEVGDGGFGWSWDGKVWAEDAAAAERFLGALQLRVEEQDGQARLLLAMPEPERALNGVESNLRLRLPAAAAADLRNEFGRVHVTGLEGRLDVRNQFGAVRLRAVGDRVSVVNSFGPIDVDGAGAADLRNEHGSIDGRGLRGRVQVHASFGPIDLEVHGGEVEVDNEHGSVRVELRDLDVRRVEIVNSFAPIEVIVPAQASPAVDIESSFGEVDTFLDLVDQDEDRFASRYRGGPPDAPLQLRLRNQHGAIELRRGGAAQ